MKIHKEDITKYSLIEAYNLMLHEDLVAWLIEAHRLILLAVDCKASKEELKEFLGTV